MGRTSSFSVLWMTVRIWALSPGNGGILRRIWDRSDMTCLTHSKERTGSVGNAV